MDKKALGEQLRKAERNRKLVNILRVPVYGVMLLWLIFVVVIQFTRPEFMQQGGTSMLNWFLPAIVVIVITQFVFARLLSAYSGVEQQITSQIFAQLYPQGRLHSNPCQVTMMELRGSKFFGRLDTQAVPATVFSSMDFPINGGSLTLMDIGVAMSRKSMLSDRLGNYITAYRILFHTIGGSRIESSMFTFRGIFAGIKLSQTVPGCVAVIPDILESKAGHMAKTVQSLTEFEGNKLVQMEDTEFENYFAVYATNEVVARRILTPAMMRTMAELRLTFGRDIYFTFNANYFYFAVSVPEGLLTLKGAEPDKLIGDIETKLGFAKKIITQLKINV